MAFNKKKMRSIAYVGIVGGCAVLALIFFSISQYQKAKKKSSDTMVNSCQLTYDALSKKSTEGMDEASIAQHKALLSYWEELTNEYIKVNKANTVAYQATAFPAYAFSMATLVAFGLVLKDAEKQKEKEDNAVA